MKRSPRSPGTPSNLSEYREFMHVELFVSAALVLAALLVSSIFVAQVVQAQAYSVLYSFKGPPDGGRPNVALILDPAGNLYGTTDRGGVSYWGTAFKLAPNEKETILYNFLAGYGASL
jgi:hypothetical protein